MPKDPAFLFYPQDFLTGTLFLSDEEVGKYIRLLCAQHQQGGLINRSVFNSIVKDSELLREKFIETEDGYFNERLMREMERRAKKASNLSANAKLRWEKEKQKENKSNAIASGLHMPIENENENINNVFKLEGGTGGEEPQQSIDYHQNIFQQHLADDYFPAWQKWLELKAERGKPVGKTRAISDIAILKDGIRNDISPADLIDRAIDDAHEGLGPSLRNMVKEKANGSLVSKYITAIYEDFKKEYMLTRDFEYTVTNKKDDTAAINNVLAFLRKKYPGSSQEELRDKMMSIWHECLLITDDKFIQENISPKLIWGKWNTILTKFKERNNGEQYSLSEDELRSIIAR